MAVALCTSQQAATGSTLPAYSVTFDRDGSRQSFVTGTALFDHFTDTMNNNYLRFRS